MKTSKTLSIDVDGAISAIYDDADRGFYDQGAVTITRASNVEPGADGLWRATMADGLVLGPFRLRAAALMAELDYLNSIL